MTIEQMLSLGVLVPLLTGIDFLVRKRLENDRDKTIADLSAKLLQATQDVADADAERDEAIKFRDTAEQSLDTVVKELETERTAHAAVKATAATQAGELVALQTDQASSARTQTTHDNRIRRALAMEGEIWTQPVMAGTPRFVPLKERRTPIVSVLNLKGGVGKTTLTANLAWALSARGYRVLMLDLDLQGSLSSLFLRTEELNRLGLEEESLFQHFFAGANRKGSHKLLEYAVPIPQLNKHCRLVAASDHLAYAEMSQTVRWLLRVGDAAHQWNGRHDGRMILRRALHAKGLYKRFDVILMDCPPLVNLCCTNALAASDYVAMPVTPSVKAIERITPLLGRIREMQREGVNPDLHPLGVIANRTDGKSLQRGELMLFHNLPRQCQNAYGSEVPRFDTVVQQRTAVRDNEEYFQAPGDDHPLRATFEALAEEFIKRLPNVCRTPDERQRRSSNGATPTGEQA